MPSIFTKIINGEIPSYKIHEDDNFIAFLDINPNTIGHTLCIPKKEIDNLFPNMEKQLRKITLLPPLTRILGVTLPYSYPFFSMIPLLKSHYIGLFKK